MKKEIRLFISIIGMLFLFIGLINAQYQMEDLGRGLVAVSMGDGSVYLGWRLLASDPDTVSFNIYRGATKMNNSPITKSTNFVDSAGTVGDMYYVTPVLGGVEQTSSETVSPWNQNYITIPLQRPEGGKTPDNVSYSYSPNDCSAGDLDGDGEYEIVLKWDPSNSHDNAHDGYTGNVYLDGYKMDGTHMWRIDLGINIRAGAHYTQFMVYDLDGDGKAEIGCKTAPGTKDATGNYLKLGPANGADHTADYRNSSGYILSGPEYFTIFNGEIGNELKTADYNPPRGSLASWGDTYGNRVDRFLACIAYLDGIKPSVVMCRGYYRGSGRGRTVLAAWDYRNGTLINRWTFNADYIGENGSYTGQGNHQLSVADVDDDGKDEIIYGACAIDDDGTGLWNSNLGHGDAMHVSDIDPDRPGLEKWGIHEGSGTGAALLDARTGEVIWKTGPGDVGRGTAANLVESYRGMECWGGTDGLRSCRNERVGSNPTSTNHVIWWDGDLSRELLDGTGISKYNGPNLLGASGCLSINGSKSNPNLQADLFGDWREEVIFRTTSNTALRIYTTTDTTGYRLVTLMHDRVYRLGIAWQNVAYNQPPHTSYYVGAGMFLPDSLRPPAPPMHLKAIALSDTVILQWDANIEPDLAGYNVYKSDFEQGPFTQLNPSLLVDTEYTDTDVINDTVYYYAVTAVDTDDNESDFSDIVEAIPTIRPDFPEGLIARNDITSVLLNWNPVSTSEILGYNVYRSKTSGSGYTLVNSTLLTETTYKNSFLIPKTTYYFVVTSVDTGMIESLHSDEISATPGYSCTMQSEDAVIGGTVYIESNHIGYHGTGFTNFETNNSSVEFTDMPGFGGGEYTLVYRYALGNIDRTGSLIVNGITQSLTMKSTTEWTNYTLDSTGITLNTGFTNTIRFESTGSDFGNLDEITIKAKEWTAIELSDSRNTNIPSDYQLYQNYPNPFNNNTQIPYAVKENCHITIKIYNNLGQCIRTLVNGPQIAKKYTIDWNGRNDMGHHVTSGLYFYKMTTSTGYRKARKMLYLK